jgi:hypothetical protein
MAYKIELISDHFRDRCFLLAVRSLHVIQFPVFEVHLSCSHFRETDDMTTKSKQLKAEESKTISITELTRLRFKTLKPYKGIIEVVNCVDMGRVCSLRVNDFKSIADAHVYAQLLVLAPQLLGAYLNDAEKLEQVVKRFERRMKALKEGRKKEKK